MKLSVPGERYHKSSAQYRVANIQGLNGQITSFEHLASWAEFRKKAACWPVIQSTIGISAPLDRCRGPDILALPYRRFGKLEQGGPAEFGAEDENHVYMTTLKHPELRSLKFWDHHRDAVVGTSLVNLRFPSVFRDYHEFEI